MKTISLRQFRDTVGSLTEPVQVVKRENGELVTLGQWSPTVLHTTEGECWCADCTAKELRLQPLPPERASFEDIARAVDLSGFGAPKPAPKPKR